MPAWVRGFDQVRRGRDGMPQVATGRSVQLEMHWQTGLGYRLRGRIQVF